VKNMKKSTGGPSNSPQKATCSGNRKKATGEGKEGRGGNTSKTNERKTKQGSCALRGGGRGVYRKEVQLTVLFARGRQSPAVSKVAGLH